MRVVYGIGAAAIASMAIPAKAATLTELTANGVTSVDDVNGVINYCSAFVMRVFDSRQNPIDRVVGSCQRLEQLSPAKLEGNLVLRTLGAVTSSIAQQATS